MSTFLDIPLEVIEQILLELDPMDVSALACTSHVFHDFIYDPANQLLWRKLYLAQPFDDLRSCVTPLGRPLVAIDWRTRLQKIIRARNAVQSDAELSEDETVDILRTLLDMASNVIPLTRPDGDDLSSSHAWLAVILRRSTLLDHDSFSSSGSSEERQLRARLHTFFGLTDKTVNLESCYRRVCSRRSFISHYIKYVPLSVGYIRLHITFLLDTGKLGH